MYYIKIEDSFDSAHFLKDYNGKCKNIHGHKWYIKVVLKCRCLQKRGSYRGMVIDFKEIKKYLKETIDKLDHKLLIEETSISQELLLLLSKDFEIYYLPFRPTAENIAKFFYDNMKKKFKNIDCVELYETPKNSVIYREEDYRDV